VLATSPPLGTQGQVKGAWWKHAAAAAAAAAAMMMTSILFSPPVGWRVYSPLMCLSVCLSQLKGFQNFEK
jgi:hypothetical protein